MQNNRELRQDFIWNLIGSVLYSLSSFYYLMLVTRVCGVTEGGVFALAFATAQLLLTFGRYGMRTFQATDTKREYSFSEYGLTRIATCAGMVLFALPYGLFMRYSAHKIWIFVWVTALKMVDAAEDVYHGELQRSFHVALMGKMLALRNLFSCVLFGILLFASRDLLCTCAVSALGSLLFCLVINRAALRSVCGREKGWEIAHVRRLFLICFPIFISTFFSLFLYNIPKYAIDRYLAEEFQTYYSILFMPSFVITLFSEIITKPLLTTISISWEEDRKKFLFVLARIYALIAAGTLLIVAGGHFLGRFLLEILYGVDLHDYRLHFIVLLFGGGLSAAVYITYNILISIRFEKYIIAGYLAVSASAVPLTYLAVSRFGVMGAAASYFFTCLALGLVFGSMLIWKILKNDRGKEERWTR